MKLKKKTIKRLEWKGIEERSYAFSPFDFRNIGIRGEAGLMRMDRVELGKSLPLPKRAIRGCILLPFMSNFGRL